MPKTSAPKVILITGTSSGFGLLTAARLASAGHNVFATMRDLSKQGALLNEVQKRAGKVTVLKLDVTDEFSASSTVAMITALAGRIDVVVNNAGFGMGGFFEDLTDDDIRKQFETNFFGVQNVARAVLPVMRKQGSGTIINISSIAGIYALPAFGAYAASKWALEAFSESLYYEVKPFGIQVAMIEPGTYNTPIFHDNKRIAKNFSNPQSPYFSLSQHLEKQTDDYVNNLKKDPEDIARLVEKIINSQNPSLRNFPDFYAKMIYIFKRILPTRVFCGILEKAMLAGVDIRRINKRF